MPVPSILIVDDEHLIRWSLIDRLKAEGHHVRVASTGAQALECARDGVDLVLLDYNLPDTDGLSVLRQLKELNPEVIVILLNAHASVETAVEAMRAGAYHVASEPFDVDDVATLVARALETIELRREVRRLHATEAQPYSVDRIVGNSPAISMVRTLLGKVARSPASTVLLMGESGTGKDLAARVLHFNSDRAHRPFISITCSAVAEALLESELFGNERGAVTDARQQKRGLFESAESGTVFLDEIGEVAPSLQAKLLRVLEEQSFKRVGGAVDVRVDVRVITATNRNLEEDVKVGRFRQDLFYRLNVLPIALPPLRQHLEDVPALLAFYIDDFNREFRKSVKGATPAALKLLQTYGWPGNIRELRNAVERAMLLVSANWLEPSDFGVATGAASPFGFELPARGLNLEAVEHSLVVQALERSHGNQTKAATLLGMNRDQIRYRIEKYALARDFQSVKMTG